MGFNSEDQRIRETVGACVPHDRAATMVGRPLRDRRDATVGGDLRARRVRLGDVVRVDTSTPFPSTSKVWLLNLDKVEQQTGRVIERLIVPREEVGNSTVAFTDKHVLHSKLRPNLNKVVVPDQDGVGTSELLPLLCDSGVLDRNYLCGFLRSPTFVSYAVGRVAGAKMPRLGSKDLLAATIPLPPLPAQREIAAELDRICAMKKNAEERVEICQQLVKSKFVEMFELDGTTRTPPLRCGVSSHHEYPVVTIGDVFHVGGPKRIHQSEWQDHGVPFLRISELSERLDGNKTKAEHYISNERYEELKAQGQVPVAGDVLVTARGTLGRCYVVGEKDDFYFQDGMITWLSQKSEKIDLSYFLNAMKSDDFKRQYEGKMPGSTVAYLSIGQLAKLKLPLPPLGEQRQFAAYVAKVEKMEAVAREMVTTADMLYRAKLQEYFG